MRILCIYLWGHPGCLGGIETFERNLKKMHSQIVFITYKNNKKKYYNIQNVIEIEKKNIIFKVLNYILGKYFILKYVISKIKYDIILINRPEEIKIIKSKNKKKILVQHTSYEEYLRTYFKNNKKLIEKCKKELDYFIFLSEYDRERFIKEINFPREKTVVIRHTCEIEILERSKLKNKELIMLCRLDNKSKRLDLAIKAMRKLSDFILNIYGDGEDKEYLENLIKEKNLKNVILHGGTNQVKEKLDENGIFIMTSDLEGYGIANIEAMRRGLPIILRNTFDSAPDIVQDNGILLDKEWNEDKFVEAVRKVYDNYDYYSENSIRMGKRHDFEVIKKEWSNLFIKLKE